MNLLFHMSDLKAVSGGVFCYDEFVTKDMIVYHGVLEAVRIGMPLGFLAGVVGFVTVGGVIGFVSVGALGAAAGAYIGYHYNDYSDIEPNTWVHWTVY